MAAGETARRDLVSLLTMLARIARSDDSGDDTESLHPTGKLNLRRALGGRYGVIGQNYSDNEKAELVSEAAFALANPRVLLAKPQLWRFLYRLMTEVSVPEIRNNYQAVFEKAWVGEAIDNYVNSPSGLATASPIDAMEVLEAIWAWASDPANQAGTAEPQPLQPSWIDTIVKAERTDFEFTSPDSNAIPSSALRAYVLDRFRFLPPSSSGWQRFVSLAPGNSYSVIDNVATQFYNKTPKQRQAALSELTPEER